VIASLARLLKTCSILICLIVIVSFGVFAIDQTKTASSRQTAQIASSEGSASGTSAGSAHESGLHKTIDEASSKLTSPFSSIVSSSSSEWASRSAKLILALLVYGFGLGYLARAMRIRV
jgi:hypothetical protein